MELPSYVREQFRRYGRTGGLARAARMTPQSRRAVACRAAATRWIHERFGATSFTSLGLPGGDIVDAGIADLAEGRTTAESLVVSLAAARLRREGVPLGQIEDNPEDRLYASLSQQTGDLAHARYGAYVRQIVSFADACRLLRYDRGRRAS